MQAFIRKPSIDFFLGVKVNKDTVLNYENERVTQTLENLVLRSVTRVKGDNFEGVYDTTINLSEGDVLIFEDEDRGYILPYGQSFVTVADAIEELTNIKDIGGGE